MLLERASQMIVRRLKRFYEEMLCGAIVLSIVRISRCLRTACVCIPRVFPLKVDLRESGVATPVEMQNPWNTCWSFAATAAIDEASAKLGDAGSDCRNVLTNSAPNSDDVNAAVASLTSPAKAGMKTEWQYSLIQCPPPSGLMVCRNAFRVICVVGDGVRLAVCD